MSRFDLDSERRIFGLDVFRAVAITIVVIGHANQLLLPWVNTRLIGGLTLGWVISVPFLFVDGVDLFFALSGFLIGGILLRHFGQVEVFARRELVNFWARRWLRTLPAYFIILLVNLALHFTILKDPTVSLSHLARYFFFVQSLTEDHLRFFQESWSLSVEEWFYLTFPLVLVGLGLTVRGRTRAWVFVAACVTYITVVVVGRAIYGVHHIATTANASWGGELRRVTLLRLDAILWGVIFSAFQAYRREAFHKYRYHLAALGVVLVLGSPLPGLRGAHQQTYMFVVYYTLLSAGYACFLPLAAAARRGRFFGHKAFTFVSVVSYSLYLVNYSIVLHVMRALFVFDTPVRAAVGYLVFLAVSIGGATGLYLTVEKPVLAYRDRVVREHAPSTTAGS